ncbi:RIC3 acetylcholine receptor chaperone isoform X2 [Temnothorax americanus]|uniref:RIC3 acetylcholine receptor chaperone isoform X2 n=1 Tax=Temnothorax americanus TaxID=1964332 RepID=UPI0040688437
MAEITDFGPRKTFFVLAIVFGCFTVLWPKILHPMFIGFVTPHHSASDSSVCCEMIFESDVTAVDIMQEMCQNILRHHPIDPRVRDALKLSKLTPQTASLCREEVLARCGIDLSSFLAERESLGKTYKQVLEEIRSFNSSLCLKMNFGVPLSQLGIPHLIRYHILMPHSTIPQERRTPPHAGGMHPALRERGRAIPTSHIVPKVTDRQKSNHVVPKMRPPLGSAGHGVQAPKGSVTMGIVMPLYTIGIVLFFLYTIVKVLKKNSDSEIISEYPGAAAEKEFRKMVFSPEALATAMTGGTLHYPREKSPRRTAPTIEELNDLDGSPKSNGLAGVDRGSKEDTADQESHSREGEELDVAEQSPTVKVMGMEMTASCESGQKCSRPTTPIIPPPSNVEREKTPPTSIYLEGALPPQCELLVTDSETQAEKSEDDDDAPVVLSGKMTLSLISLDQIPADSEAEDPDKKRKKVSDTQAEIRDVKDKKNKILQKKEEDKENREVEEDENEEVEEQENGEVEKQENGEVEEENEEVEEEGSEEEEEEESEEEEEEEESEEEEKGGEEESEEEEKGGEEEKEEKKKKEKELEEEEDEEWEEDEEDEEDEDEDEDEDDEDEDEDEDYRKVTYNLGKNIGKE